MYEQLEGAAKGFQLSPVVAHIYMEKFEEDALSSGFTEFIDITTPGLWRRYVDDMFVLLIHDTDKLEQFHNHLNQQHPQIQFTREEETTIKSVSWTS